MERAGFEADRQRIALYNRKTGELTYPTQDIDISVSGLTWAPDSKSIYFDANNEIYNSIYNFDLATGKETILVKERINDKLAVTNDGKRIYFTRQASRMPHEIFCVDVDSKNVKQITYLNKTLLDQIAWNEIETFWTEGAEGAKVQSILVKPPHFDETKKYPLIFLIHGGPQGHWSDNFHYRWNTQMFASQGYVVVATNPRGSTGYGQDFVDGIRMDWGGKVYEDLMKSLDYALATYKFIDDKNVFATGASYGGYMIAWIEGHTDRFNALVNHDGLYNMESFYGTTEEIWFPHWEFGGCTMGKSRSL